PLPAKTPIPTSGDGLRHPDCFASALGHCKLPMTKEHFISQNMLEVVGDGKLVTVTRFLPRASKDVVQTIGVDGLSARMLCNAHNSSLSPLHSRAGRSFRRLADVHDRAPAASGHTVYAFNGHDLERWMLKCLCGLIASGTSAHADQALPKATPPKEFLMALYGLEPLPVGWGMYLLRDDNPFTSVSHGPLVDRSLTDPVQIVGATMTLLGLEFVLAMRSPGNRGGLLAGAIYR